LMRLGGVLQGGGTSRCDPLTSRAGSRERRDGIEAWPRILGNADHARTEAISGIAAWLTSIVRLGMHDHSPAEYAILSMIEGDPFDCQDVGGIAIVIGLEISEVTGMALIVAGQSVRMTVWIEMLPCAGSIVASKVAELVNVKRMLRPGIQTADDRGDLHPVHGLFEHDGSGHIALADRTDDGDQLGDFHLRRHPVAWSGDIRNRLIARFADLRKAGGSECKQNQCGGLRDGNAFHNRWIETGWNGEFRARLVPRWNSVPKRSTISSDILIVANAHEGTIYRLMVVVRWVVTPTGA
jgi:hypothetical protein